MPELGLDHRQRLVSGRGRYLADLPFEGVDAAFVRSPYAHARIRSISLPADAADGAALGLNTLRVDGPGLAPCLWSARAMRASRWRWSGRPTATWPRTSPTP